MAPKPEFIQEWNNIVTFKISENDLKQPTFEFFFKALDSLLRALNVNVEYMKENLPENDADRIFYIRFCKYVNRLYKLCDKSFNFYFMDLINPTPKKSCHVLKMLLNYLIFYEMTKKEVIEKANGHLAKYNEALRIKNDLETKIEKNKKRAQRIERDLREYEARMPEIKKNIDALVAEEIRIDTECAQKLNDIKNSETILSTLDRRGIELDQQIVNENEYDDYLLGIEKANKELASLNQAVEHSKTSNMNTCRAIDEMEQILKEILALVHGTDVDELEETVRVEEKLAKLQDEIVAKQTQIKDIADNEALIVAECKTLEMKLKQTEIDGKKFDESAKVRAADLEKKIKTMQGQVNALRIRHASAEENLHEEEEIQECLIRSFDQILSQIAATFDDN